ncbi:MAG TPA: hypothetical protein VIT91_09810 [Chthoniobacterales bacterium]
MPSEKISYGGWTRNLRLFNESVEVVVTLEVGPRILSYRPVTASDDGVNVLKNYPEQLGGAAEAEWKIRGGHRLWVAPEHPVLSYTRDNVPFSYELLGDQGICATNPGIEPWYLKKETTIQLAPAGSGVTIEHTIINESDDTWEVAPWALTVMAPGGVSILPQPPLGEHPRDLLPNRVIVAWPYSDLSDSRLHVGRHVLTLEQRAGCVPFKIGLAHQGGYVAYLLGNQLFVKTVPYCAGMRYADFGCNYESFTNDEMIEIETLGPLTELPPGASVSHTEEWRLFGDVSPPLKRDTPEFVEWLASLLRQTGLA